jgi:UDP-N-acetylglucosamine transferase subunit ALG13
MIFVTLGTNDEEFTRLLKAIDKEIEKGTIKERVVVQAGCTKYQSKKMEIMDLIPREEFDKYISECDLLITHGGVGSILAGINHNKKVIAVPRLAKYKEHGNDHQLQIVNNFSERKYILAVKDLNKLGKTIEKARKFKPQKFVSNTHNIINMIEDYIDNL